MKKRRRIVLLCTILVLLLIPFIGMQFSDNVNWNLLDFIVAAFLLFGTFLSIEVILHVIKVRKWRIVLIAVTLLILILVVVELAVGIFASPIAGS